MPLGLNPQESYDAWDAASRAAPAQPAQPGALEGSIGAIGSGIEEGATKAVLAMPAHSAPPGPFAPDWVYEAYAKQVQKEADPAYKERLAADSAAVVKSMQPNPHTTGVAGQMLFGLSSGLTRFAVGSVATGSPVGGAVVVGGSEGVATAHDLQAQGVDEDTANALGAGTALFAGGASLLPGGYGKGLVERVLTGAGANVTSGFAQRGLTHNVLADAGYTAQAAQYRALDAQAMMADAVLGAGFGLVHHVFEPSTIDAAHTVADADHIETSAPGVPIDPVSRQAHVANMDAAAEALISGEPMRPLHDVETIPNLHADAASEAAATAVREAAAEAVGEPVAAAREGERRQDSLDAQRMAELRNTPDRTPEQQAEYVGLLEKDRLAAKVGGRAIKGLLSREAYEEMAARGEAKPYVAYFDLDMFKDINDQYGMHQGDEAIRATGEAAAAIAGEGNAFKGSERAGDEFMIHGDSPEQLESQIAALRQHLQNHVIELRKNGKLVKSRKGLEFSHGIGRTVDEAAAASKLAKGERARLGFRADRGAVPETVSGTVRRGGGEAPAGAKAGSEVTAARATTELTDALRQLDQSDGTDQAAHERVRTLLQQAADSGHDVAAIERAATERAGGRAEGLLASAKASEHAAIDSAGLDPTTREAVDAAQRVIEAAPETTIPGEDGKPIAARDALRQAVGDLADAQSEGELHKIAAACFGRG